MVNKSKFNWSIKRWLNHIGFSLILITLIGYSIGGAKAFPFSDDTLAESYTKATGVFPRSIHGVDFNGDGNTDLVTANQSGSSASVLISNGDGTFADQIEVSTGGNSYAVFAGDFDGINGADIATANTNSTMTVLLNNGDETFSRTDLSSATAVYGIWGGDFDADGDLDLATANANSAQLRIFNNDGSGVFTNNLTYSTIDASPSTVCVADLDGDNWLDIVTANEGAGNSLSVFLNDGTGEFVIQATRPTAGGAPNSVVAVDVNNDSILDLITANISGNSASVLIGNGDGSFSSKVDYSVGSSPRDLFVTDVDNDETVDLIIPSSVGNFVSVLFGNGDGTFDEANRIDYPTGNYPQSLWIDSFDGGDNKDLAVANVVDNSISILFSLVNAIPAGGTGSVDDPYQISTCLQLQDIQSDLAANYILIDDIDCSATVGWNGGEGFVPIGDSTTRFTGSLDGDGYVVSDLYINNTTRTGANSVSFIGNSFSGAKISNLGLENVDITSTNTAGGLVGNDSGAVITNSYVTGQVTGVHEVGGLSGYSQRAGGVISNCYTDVVVSGSTVGGFVGLSLEGTITDSYSLGAVIGTGVTTGGFVGNIRENSHIYNSYSTGLVLPVAGGGFAGAITNGGQVLSDNFWDVTASGQADSATGTGKTTAEMKTNDTFDTAGWDIEYNDADLNNGYPYLSWQNGGVDTIWNIVYSIPVVPAGVTVSEISGDTSEDGGVATYTVVLDSEPSGDVVIESVSSDFTEGSVTNGYSLLFTIDDWDVPQEVTITGVNDQIDDGDMSYNILVTINELETLGIEYKEIDPSDVSVINTATEINHDNGRRGYPASIGIKIKSKHCFYTNKGTEATITLKGKDVASYILSDNTAFSGAEWKPFVSSPMDIDWIFEEPGIYSFYVQFQNSEGVMSVIYEDTVTVEDCITTEIKSSSFPIDFPYSSGTVLKAKDSVKVFLVDDLGNKRWILNEDTLFNYVNSWGEVKRVESSILEKLSEGEKIQKPLPANFSERIKSVTASFLKKMY